MTLPWRYFSKLLSIMLTNLCCRYGSWKQCFLLLILATFSIYLLLYSVAIIAFNTILIKQSPPYHHHLHDNNSELSSLLKRTPYLWRQTNLTVKERIRAQREWVVGLSQIGDVHTLPKKKIVLEMPSAYFYYTAGRSQCSYAPEFEHRCTIQVMSSLRWWLGLGPWRYFGLEADAIVTIHNSDYRPTFKLPVGMQQVFYILEPPQKFGAGRAPLGYNDALLASYWRGSDIPIPYKLWVPSPQNQGPPPSSRRKRRLVVAIVSNCWSKGRLTYIKYLQQFIPVDIYGSCGTFSCAKSNYSGCLAALGEEYKFYLSFENNKCEDYITEKFFVNALGNGMVPIVQGARPSDYFEAAPPSSYIIVEDFPSPRHLANYLLQLDKNDTAYQEFFAWKGTGEISSDGMADFFCRLCGLLHYAEYVPPPSWGGSEVIWSTVNKCLGDDKIEPWS